MKTKQLGETMINTNQRSTFTTISLALSNRMLHCHVMTTNCQNKPDVNRSVAIEQPDMSARTMPIDVLNLLKYVFRKSFSIRLMCWFLKKSDVLGPLQTLLYLIVGKSLKITMVLTVFALPNEQQLFTFFSKK